MASAIARPNFCFHLNGAKYPQMTQIAPPHLAFTRRTIFLKPLLITSSVDVSQEDKPLDSNADTAETEPEEAATDPDQDQEQELNQGIDLRRMEEKFAVLNTGVYECRSCGYLYDQAKGDPAYPIAPGLDFVSLPSDWRCPTCGAAQSFFDSKSIEVAGFAQNQQFGLGGNSLTSGQKTLLIYSSLLFFFALFLSGYFLQ